MRPLCLSPAAWLWIRFCSLLCIASTGHARADDPWNVLPSVTYPDLATTLPIAPALAQSVSDAADLARQFQPPAQREVWEQRRPQVREALRRSLGLEPWPDRQPLKARVTATHGRGGIVMENIVFESRPGFPVTALLYRPAAPSTQRLPAIVSPIGHFLSAGKSATDVQARCLGLAQRGFITLAYDAIGQGERLAMGNVHHDAGYALLPLGETIAGWMVWDTMRAIDYLVSRDDVDPTRIGITGNSGGGLNTLLTSALDERIKTAVVVGFTFEFADWIRYGGTHCTCTHFPGLLRDAEWFEIAGLISPRPLLMIQGDQDRIFPIQGATRAAHGTETIYRLLEAEDRVRFLALQNQPHAYTEPFRKPMYGWFTQWLQPKQPQPISEPSEPSPLPESDSRLLCDPDRSWIPSAPTVVDWARSTALRTVARLPTPQPSDHLAAVSLWVQKLTAPSPLPPAYLAPRSWNRGDASVAQPEKWSVVSEPGVILPGLLWNRPPSPAFSNAPSPRPVVLFVHAEGKATVAQSPWVPPLLHAGFAVLACDLRGRGESLAKHGPRHDINFRLVATQILSGQPIAGRRAFDLRRILDFIQLRKELDASRITVVGIGDDALPALLAAASDPRIRQLALVDFFHSFASAMRARPPVAPSRMGDAWNDPQLDGRIGTGKHTVDFGSIIPGCLMHADLPDLVALLAPRPILACQFRDHGDPLAAGTAVRFRDTLRSPTANRSEYSPDSPFDAARLLAWLQRP